MKVIFLFVIVCLLGVSAQRRGSKVDDTNVEASPKAANVRSSRGRARFTATSEFAEISSEDSLDTKKIAKRIETPKKVQENAKVERRISRPPKEPLKLYEVSETVDDIPREEMKKIVLGAPGVVTESKFESLNLAKPLPISSSTTEENTPNYPKLPEVTQSAESSVVNEDTAVIDDVPKITPELPRKVEATTVKVKPTIKQKVPHRRFNVKAQSTTEKSEDTTAAKRKTRVRGQTKPETASTTAASVRVRQTRKRVEHVADSGPSVFNSEGRDTGARSRTGRTVNPILEKRSDDADGIYFASDPHPRENRSKGRYTESNSEESNESLNRSQNRQRTSSRRKGTSQSTTTSTESNSRRKTRVSSTEKSIDSNENTSRGSRRKSPSRGTRVESSIPISSTAEPRQARTRQRVKVIKKEPENRLNVVPNSNEKQASQIDDFATSSTKDFEVRMLAENLNVVTPVTSRNSIRVSRQHTISVESKTEKAIRKVFRKKSGASPSVSQEAPSSSEGSVERVTQQSSVKVEEKTDGKRRVPQAAQRRTIVSPNKQRSTELTASEEAIGGEENYPINFIANIKAKKSRKGTGSSSSQSSKDSLTKTIEKGAASAKPSASLESPTPSESAIVESYANKVESSSHRSESIAKSKRLPGRPVFPKRTKVENEKPAVTATPSSVSEPSTASDVNQTPLQKYHARFKLTRNQNQKEIVTSPRPIHKSRSYLPKAPKGIYSSKKLSRSTTASPVTETEKLKKINIEASALSTQVPPKGSNPNKATRFSARYRNDILARPGILRTSTSGPPYIPTVPTVTPSPSSVKIEDNLLGLEVISIDDPIVNTVPSANLINGDYISTQNGSTTVGSKEGEDQKPISIIERIINSITSISTTTSPDSNTTITTTTNGQPTTESAIQRLVSKKSRSTLDEDILDKLTTTSNVKTTEKPTTVIEKILSSLSALRANQATEINLQQVGGNYNTLAGVSSTESISEIAEKSSPTLPSTPSLLTSDSSTETPTSTASSFSTVGSTDSSIPSTLLSLNDISTFSLDASSSVSSSTLNPNFAIQDLTSDQTLPKRTVDQLLSLFNMQTPTTTTTGTETTNVVVVTPKLTTFVTSNTITPAPLVTSTDLLTTVVTSKTETDNATPRVITTSTLISILTTRIELKDFDTVTVTNSVSETGSVKLISPTTDSTTTELKTERTVTVTPFTDSTTTPMSTTNTEIKTESSTMPLTTVSSNTEQSTTSVPSTTFITTPDPTSITPSTFLPEQITSGTVSTLSSDQTTTVLTPSSDQTTVSSESTSTVSTTSNTINDAENFINPLSVNTQNLQSDRLVSTIFPDQTTTGSTLLPDQTSTTVPTISTDQTTVSTVSSEQTSTTVPTVSSDQSSTTVSTVVPDQTSTTVSTVLPDQTSTTVPTVVPDQASTAVPTVLPDQTSTTVSTVLPDQTSTTVPTVLPDQTSTTVSTVSSDQTSTTVPTLLPEQASTTVPSTLLPDRTSTVSSDQTSTTVPTILPDGTPSTIASTLSSDQTTASTINDAENFINPLSVTIQPEILSIMDLIAQIMDQNSKPSGSATSTLSPEFEVSTINPIFYTTTENFATASENIPVITKFSSPLLDQVVSSTDSPVQTTNDTLTTTPSDTLTTTENTMLDSSSKFNTETTTDVSSTIPLVDKFEVSLDRVKVSSANDLSSTLTADDDVAGTTISIMSRNFIPDTNSTSTADVTSVNNSLDTTTQDISSNTIDTIEITEKLNGTDVFNLVNPLSSDTNVSVTDPSNTTLSMSNNTSVNNTRAGKRISLEQNPIDDNSIDNPVREKDYYIFAVLQNNTILRKRPSQHPTKETPFIIYGLLPNNTLLRKFLNGTLVPMEPVIQVNGFDTRENPPPITESNNINQVTSIQENQPENISTTTGRSIEANELSLNGVSNDTQDNAIPKLTELLGKNTVRAFNNIVNQTQGNNQNQTVQVITLQVDPKIQNRLNAEGSTVKTSTSSRPPSTTTKITTTKPGTTITTSKAVTAESKTVPVVFTSPLPTTTTKKQTKPTTTTPKRTTTTRPPTTIRNEESNNEIEPNPLSISSRVSTTTVTVPPTTVLSVTKKPLKDISIEELKKKNLTEQQRKDLATLEALENEHKSILQQLSFLTKLNFGGVNNGVNSSKSNASNQVGVKVPVEAAKTAKVTTTPLPIVELLKQLNGNGVTPPSQVLASTYGKTNDALLASLLKEYGVVPTAPKPLADVLSQITDTTTGLPSTTTATKRRTTTTPAPNRFMQGLNWLINTIAPQPTTRPISKSKSPKSNRLNEENEVLSKQPTEITPTIVEAPTTKSINNGIPQEKLHALIKQLEEVKKNPDSAKNLDIETLKSLQKLKSKDIKDIQVIASSSNGASMKKFNPTKMPILPTMLNFGEFDVSPLINNRGRPDRATTQDPLVNDDTPTTKLKLPPVKLNSVKGISDEEPLIQGQLVNYAIDVTKAISSFLGNALQGAATSFQSMIGSGSRTSRNRTMFNSSKRTG